MKTFQLLSVLVCFSCIFMLIDEVVLAPLLFASIGTTKVQGKAFPCQDKAELTFDSKHITRLYIMSMRN